MPIKLVGADCKLFIKQFTDKDGSTRTYLLCETAQSGKPCPRDTKTGKKSYETCLACFESVSLQDFFAGDAMSEWIKDQSAKECTPTTARGVEYEKIAKG